MSCLFSSALLGVEIAFVMASSNRAVLEVEMVMSINATVVKGLGVRLHNM
jgi:hypothetical protein